MHGPAILEQTTGSRKRPSPLQGRWGSDCAAWCRAAMHPQGLLQGSPGSWHFSLSGREMSMLQTLRERYRMSSGDVAPRRKCFPPRSLRKMKLQWSWLKTYPINTTGTAGRVTSCVCLSEVLAGEVKQAGTAPSREER